MKVLLRSLLALAVSGGLLAWVLNRADLGVLTARAAEARPGAVAVAFLCSLIVLLLRAQRFQALAERAPYPVTVAAVAVQNFLVRVTPFRVGELGLPVVLHRYAGEPMARSVVNVVLVRLVELWALLLLGAGATAAFVGALEPRSGGQGGLGSALTLVLLAGVTLAVFTFRWWLGGLIRLARRLLGNETTQGSLAKKLAGTLDRLAAVLSDGERLSLRARVQLGLGTLGIAVFQYSLYAALLAVFSVRASVVQVLVGGTAAQFASAVPVPSVGSIGPLESAWVAGFTWVGIAPVDAVLTAVGCQVITLGFAGLFALGAWIYLSVRDKPTPAGEECAPGGEA